MPDSDSLYLQMADAIAQSIQTGVLLHGERVDSVRAAARRHGVSVATAVRAYRSLEDARLIEARPRSGYFVTAGAARLHEPKALRLPERPRAVALHSLTAQVRQFAHDPAYISFGAAAPGDGLFDADRVRRTVNRTVQRERALLTQYPQGSAQEALRRAIARHALGLGCVLDIAQIAVTSGCVEAISLGLRAATQPGDVVALESPTYFAFLEILQALHLRALEIPTDPRTGLSLNALTLALQTQPVKAVLAVPTLSNPLGACMPPAERRRLAAMMAAHDIPLIEDVIYNELAVQDDKRRAVRAFDTSGHVMLCGSFSKTLAPGIRLGWIQAGRWHAQVERLKDATGSRQTPVLEMAMADLLSQPGQAAAFRSLRNAMAARVHEARHLIAASFPKGTRVTDPPGGFVLWLEMPKAIDAQALFEACLAERICISPGGLFSSTNRYGHCIRLGLGGRWDDAMRAALCRVGALAHAVAGLQRAAAPGAKATALPQPAQPHRAAAGAAS